MPYRVWFERGAEVALARLRAADRTRILAGIRERLVYEPHKEDTNRKPMRDDGLGALWELRIQPFRVYYDVDEETQTVWVLDIARKDRESARGV